MLSKRSSFGLALAVLLSAATPASAQDFAGKTIDLLVGAPPGGGYDIYARTLARHVGRHIPGQPTIVAKNMPGAGSARAAGFISSIAPIAMALGVPIAPLALLVAVEMVPDIFRTLGNVSMDVAITTAVDRGVEPEAADRPA